MDVEIMRQYQAMALHLQTQQLMMAAAWVDQANVQRGGAEEEEARSSSGRDPKCSVCHKIFTRPDNARRHMLIQHGITGWCTLTAFASIPSARFR